MTLSWNEIKSRATTFSRDWVDASNEDADAKPFLVSFFDVFGLSQRKVASFEHRVKKLDNHDGYIDMFYKGVLLVEMKSRGKDLDRAYTQARDYLHGLPDHELPSHILISDFQSFRLYDLVADQVVEFLLSDLYLNVKHFGFLIGYQTSAYKEQDPVNIKAAELMGRLHDNLKEIGYEGHALELYLVRLLFCLFADDTTIFEKDLFKDFLEQRTNPDGSDTAARLAELFHILNTPEDRRLRNLDEQLSTFPYVNGKLFEEPLPPASFDSSMRAILLECCTLDWGKISPAIFGSMFQSVMNPVERRNLGAHYTSEKNILKLIKPLFLDELWNEFEKVKKNERKLIQFHEKLSTLRFLDPACGCGNFLVVTYRELRELELAVLQQMRKASQQIISDVSLIMKVDVDQFYGIEYEEFPARIAEVAMWLMDHQMNMRVSQDFGQYFIRLPLKKSATIVHGNALRIPWESIVAPSELNYILGNPPFYGYSFQTSSQKEDMNLVFSGVKGAGVLDYVSCWYLIAGKYTLNTGISVAFVSTNSITQGEQVGILWNLLINQLGLEIHFAHRTFNWSNEARGRAAVHVVIIGFGHKKKLTKLLWDYTDINGDPILSEVKNINPYLVDATSILLDKKTSPINSVPSMVKGSSPTDGGHLLLSDEEKIQLTNQYPESEKFIRRYIGSQEYINDIKRWCLWLKDSDPSEIRKIPEISRRLDLVRAFRESSSKGNTREYSKFPSLFIEERQPNEDYLLIPRVSSMNRKYIPVGYLDKSIIVSDSAIALPDANKYVFGVITSEMHMTWVRYTCGRLKSDFRYSNTLVYNNYPWPENPTEKQKQAIEEAAQAVLDARAQFPNSSLATLYDPRTMPPVLVRAHQQLDKAVDLAYRPQPFTTEAKRMEFLFELYEKYTSGLFATDKKKK
jgi:hypothetical protein